MRSVGGSGGFFPLSRDIEDSNWSWATVYKFEGSRIFIRTTIRWVTNRVPFKGLGPVTIVVQLHMPACCLKVRVKSKLNIFLKVSNI